MLYFKFFINIIANQVLEIYIQQGHGRFLGDGFCFIQENGRNRTFENLIVEKAEIKDLTVGGNIVLPKIPILNTAQINTEKISVSDKLQTKNLEILGVTIYNDGEKFFGVADYSKIANMKFVLNQIKPIEYISFRRDANWLPIISIQSFSIEKMFNKKYFSYKEPARRLQIYNISRYTLFHIELHHRVYNKAIAPSKDSTFKQPARIQLLFSIQPYIDEFILFNNILTCYSGAAVFISNIQSNERLNDRS